MDLTKMIEELREEKEKLDGIIAALEELQTDTTARTSLRPLRGRKSMGTKERRQVSERMRKYWQRRRRSD